MQYAIHGSPITSVCTASASTAANAAARPAAHRSSRPARTRPARSAEPPGDPEQRAEHAELDAELRVVRLAGLQRRVRCATPSGRRCRARSPAGGATIVRAPSFRLTQCECSDGSLRARRAEVRRAARARSRCWYVQVDLRPVAGRPDLREEVRPAERDARRRRPPRRARPGAGARARARRARRRARRATSARTSTAGPLP